MDIGTKMLVADANLTLAPMGEVVIEHETVGGCNNKKLKRLAHKK